jgi:ArsR family transcriptional regulator
MTAALAPFVAKVVAVDNSAAMLAVAKRRLTGTAAVDFRRGDLEDLPLADGELDAAVLTLVLPYLADPGSALVEVARVVAPGGRVLVTDLLPHDRDGYRQQLGHQWLGFSEAQMAGWLTEAGFVETRIQALASEPDAKGPGLFVARGRRTG